MIVMADKYFEVQLGFLWYSDYMSLVTLKLSFYEVKKGSSEVINCGT